MRLQISAKVKAELKKSGRKKKTARKMRSVFPGHTLENRSKASQCHEAVMND